MARGRNQNLQRAPSTPPAKATPEQPEVLPPQGTPPLINAHIIQILIEKEDIGDVEKLMNLELSYNEKRLEIIRRNAEEHPDAKLTRENKRFRKTQMIALITLLFGMVGAMPFVSIAVDGLFGILCMLIVVGCVLNARDRDVDLKALVELFSVVLKKKP